MSIFKYILTFGTFRFNDGSLLVTFTLKHFCNCSFNLVPHLIQSADTEEEGKFKSWQVESEAARVEKSDLSQVNILLQGTSCKLHTHLLYCMMRGACQIFIPS